MDRAKTDAPSGIAIRRIGAGDADLFANVAPAVFDEPIVKERVAVYLARPEHMMVLAFDGDLVVGQCAAVIHHHPDKPDELYVDEVGTDDAYLRRGIATAMMEEMFAWARERGCVDAWLGTEIDNDAANALYRRLKVGEGETMVYYEFDL